MALQLKQSNGAVVGGRRGYHRLNNNKPIIIIIKSMVWPKLWYLPYYKSLSFRIICLRIREGQIQYGPNWRASANTTYLRHACRQDPAANSNQRNIVCPFCRAPFSPNGDQSTHDFDMLIFLLTSWLLVGDRKRLGNPLLYQQIFRRLCRIKEYSVAF